MKKTEDMIKFEKETGKKAIWLDRITNDFIKWQKGEKVYKKNKERINILVSEERKKGWNKFAEVNNIPTISKLIRKSVDFYIDSKSKSHKLEDFSKFSHKLKEELSSIKGFSHILIEESKDELSWDVLLKIKEIFDKSVNIEKLLIGILNDQDYIPVNYDVLIIDDDNSTVYLISEFFKKRGHTFKAIGLGNEAIDLLQKFKPSLILLDILLPDSNGYEICKIIKSDKNLKDIPVYYITAVPESEVKNKISSTGADGYLLKPFDMFQFNTLLNYL